MPARNAHLLASNRRRLHRDFWLLHYRKDDSDRAYILRASVVLSKYPPAEPGALGIGPLKAAGLDPKPHLCGPRRKHSLEIPPQPVIQFFLRLLENKYLFADILRPTCRGFKVSWSPVEELPFVCVVAHGMEFIDGRLP